MSNPALYNYANGLLQVSADNLNTFVQSCTNMADLRAFAANNTAIMVYVRGTTTPDDGGQGAFYWNATVKGTDDNGITTVVPTGVALGCWSRLSISISTVPVTAQGGTTAQTLAARFGQALTVKDFGAVGDGATDDTAAFQAAHDYYYNLAVASGNNNPSGSIYIPAAKYKLNSQLNWKSWIKLISLGPTYLDFSGLSTSGTAFRISNDTGPTTSPGKNSANTGPVLNGSQGVIYISGPATTGSSIGLDMGNSSSLPAARDFRDVQLESVVVSNFNILLNLRDFDTYLNTIKNSRFEIAGSAVVAITAGSGANAGERMGFENCTFAGGAVAFNITTPAYDINCINCSFDFNTNSAFQFNVGAGFQKITLTDCHLESSNNVAIINSSLASSNALCVQLTDCKINPTINLPAPAGAYTDGTSAPWTALFKGAMALSVKGLQIGGYTHPAYGASDGLFMCDSNVQLLGMSHLTFSAFRQVISPAQILNYNYNFNIGTSGTVLDYSSIAGWIFVSSLGLTAALSNAQTYNGSANSLAFTYSAGSNFYIMESSAFDLTQRDLPTFQNVLYGGTSTGILNCQMQLVQYQEASLPICVISGITCTGTLATATTATNHGLIVGCHVNVTGATQAAYNGEKVVTSVTSNTFSYRVPSGTVTPATGTPTYAPEPLIPINFGASLGDSFSSIYSTTTDPAYTGNRLWWAKQGVISSGLGTNNNAVVAGVTMARMRLTVSNFNAGDTAYLGTSLMEKT